MARGFNTIGVFGDINPGTGSYVHSNSNWVGDTSSPGVPSADTVLYREGDIVSHANSLWVALRNNDNVEPTANNSADWRVIATGEGQFLLAGANQGDLETTFAAASPFTTAATDPTFDYGTTRNFLASETSADQALAYARNALGIFQVPNADTITFTVGSVGNAHPRDFTLTTDFTLSYINPTTNAPEGWYINGDPLVIPDETVLTVAINRGGNGDHSVNLTFNDVPRTNEFNSNLAPFSLVRTPVFRIQSDTVVSGSQLRIAAQNPLIGFTNEAGDEFNLGVAPRSINSDYITDNTVGPGQVSTDIVTRNELLRRAFNTREVQRFTVMGDTANDPSAGGGNNEVITFRLPPGFSSGTATNFGPANSISQGIANTAVDILEQTATDSNIALNAAQIQSTGGSVAFTNTSLPVLTFDDHTFLGSGTEWSAIRSVSFNRRNEQLAAQTIVDAFNMITDVARRIILVYCDDNNWASYAIQDVGANSNRGAQVIGNAVVLYTTGRTLGSQGRLTANPRVFVADMNTLPTERRELGSYSFTIDTSANSPFTNTNFENAPQGMPGVSPTLTGTYMLISELVDGNTVMREQNAREALTAIGDHVTRYFGTPRSGSMVQGVEVRPIVSPSATSDYLTMEIHTNVAEVTPDLSIMGYGYQIRNAQGLLLENFLGSAGGTESASIVTVIEPGTAEVFSFALASTTTRQSFIDQFVREVNLRRPTDQELRESTLTAAWEARNPDGTDDVLLTSLLTGDITSPWTITIDHGGVTTAGRISVTATSEESRGGDVILGLTPESPRSDANTITTVPRYPTDTGVSTYLFNLDRTEDTPSASWTRVVTNPEEPGRPGHQVLRTLTIGNITYDIAASSVNPRAVAFFADANEAQTLPGYAADTAGDADMYNLMYDVTIRNVDLDSTNLLNSFSLAYGLEGQATINTITQADTTEYSRQVNNNPNELTLRFNVNIPQQTPVGNQRFVFNINFDGNFPDSVEPVEVDTVGITTTLTFTDQRREPTVTPSSYTQSLFDTSAAGDFTIDFMQGGDLGTAYDIVANVFNLAINEGPVMNRTNTDSFSSALVNEDTDYTVSFLLRTAMDSTTTSTHGQTTVPDPITVNVDVYTPFFFGTSVDSAIALLTGTVTQADINMLLNQSDVEFTNDDTITISSVPVDPGPSDTTSGVVGDPIYMIVDESIFTDNNVFTPPTLSTDLGIITGNSVGSVTVEHAVSGSSTLRIIRYAEFTNTVTYTLGGRV